MLEKVKKTIDEYDDLTSQVSSPEILNDHLKLADLSKQQSDLEQLYKKCKEYKNKYDAYNENLELIFKFLEITIKMLRQRNLEVFI